MRNALQKTFESRHLAYTNGTAKLEGLPDPWDKVQRPKKTRKTRKKDKAKEQAKEQVPAKTAAAVAEPDDAYVYDSEEGEWVKVQE